MQSELKQCPFCSEQCATLVIDQGDKWAHYEPSCLEVRTGYDLSDDAAWRAEAITAWNTRASDAEITRLTEALRAAEEQTGLLRAGLERIAHRDPWTDPDSPERIARDTLAGAKP